ncbi:MAG: IclR family transcriptional regulator [Candidatus Limnocylindrales bacterium]|jgi:DNA-binding IclR family transcriptional regulator
MRSLERMVAILEAVAASREPLSVKRLAALVGLSTSTTWRIANELAAQGLLEQPSDRGGYRLGGRLLSIASTSSAQYEVLGVALSEMEALRDETGETVALHVRSVDRRICIAEVQSRQAVRRVVPIGLSLPLHVGATGLALVSALPEAERESYLSGLTLSASEDRALRANLKEVVARGWAYESNTWAKEVAGWAVPIQSAGELRAALSVSGPYLRWTQSAMRRCLPAGLTAAERIGIGIGRTWGR